MDIQFSSVEMRGWFERLLHPDLTLGQRRQLGRHVIKGFFWFQASKTSAWVNDIQHSDFDLSFLRSKIAQFGTRNTFQEIFLRFTQKMERGESDAWGQVRSIACDYGLEEDDRQFDGESDEEHWNRIMAEIEFLNLLWAEAGKYYVFKLAQGCGTSVPKQS